MADDDEEINKARKLGNRRQMSGPPRGAPTLWKQRNMNPFSNIHNMNNPGPVIGNKIPHQNQRYNTRPFNTPSTSAPRKFSENSYFNINRQQVSNLRFYEKENVFQKQVTAGLGYRKLQELSEMSPQKVLTTLGIESNNLNAFLKNEPKPDVMVLFVKCLFKLTETEFDAPKQNLFVLVCESSFIDVLRRYISDLHYMKNLDKENNKLFWNDKENFFKNVLTFSETVIRLSPGTALDSVGKLLDAVKISLEGLKVYLSVKFSEELLVIFQEVLNKYDLCIKKIEMERKKLGSAVGAEGDNLPPNDFRKIQIMPSKEDLFNKPEFLRPNIVDGAYKSAEHYLDVQFRLMREDFIAPLREALKEYNHLKVNTKHGGARFYKNAKLLNYKLKQGVLAVEVCYDKKMYNRGKKQQRMANSKYFTYGSLLCLTCDNFGTIIFCTVYDKDDIAYGKIAVEMTGQQITDDMFNKDYLLVESDAYFLPYFHVLKALQDPSLATDFPFEDYIINVKTDEKPPKYLKDLKKYSLFNGVKVSLDDESTWPSAAVLGLDETQYRAYKMALTREFVTIQGPPGTGKTFIGLKIGETLLKNGYLTKTNCLGIFGIRPILVVCYTNHALDQFLEGLLLVTKNLVRIGGQSKNEKISKYNLSALRKSGKIDINYNRLRNKLKDCSREIESYQAVLQSLQRQDHVFDVTENIIRFDLPHDISIVRKFHLPFNLKMFLNKFHGGGRPALVNWLLLTDYQNDPKLRDTFEKISYQDDTDYFEDDQVESTFREDNFNCDPRRPDVHAEFSSDCVFDTHSLEFSIKNLQRMLVQAEENTHRQFKNTYERNRCITQHRYLQSEMQHLKWRLWRGDTGYRKFDFKSDTVASSYSPDDRWSLYWKCVAILEKNLVNEFAPAIKIFQDQKTIFDQLTQALELNILERAFVVGVTTSGAARLQSQLKSLHSPIVIVEEAAEVMESHIVVSLTKDCEHLIMIGDHQQLRPITATYQMATKFNLDISLFERMVNNGSHCYPLAVQHRMRPEIARLITPAIYPNLGNHASVETYPDVTGVVKNVYFIDHTEPETHLKDTSSRLNDHEAEFLLHLAKYLIQQGYAPDEITILATYAGQMFHLRNKRKNISILEEVKICVLDNFQGEENRIILLSLVRSNPEGNIGFLATDNRVCVGLSRAREGFYIIGNMGILKSKSPLWDSINYTLMKQDSIGPNLMLCCQIHSDIQTMVKDASDFSEVPEGGCMKPCEGLLPCGHYCTSLCHPGDPAHELFKCKEKCEKIICDLGHECPLICFEDCPPCEQYVKRTLVCGHEVKLKCCIDHLTYECKKTVNVEMPLCHHQGTKLCHDDLANAKCGEPCTDRLECGHACRLNCHKNSDPDHLKYKCNMSCARPNKDCSENHMCKKTCSEKCSTCTIQVMKQRSCTHKLMVACQQDVNAIPCTKKCKRSLKCGHFCKQPCNEACDEKLCLTKVSKKKSCGHTVNVCCGEDPDQHQCEKKCLKTSPCGHPCYNLCYQICTRSTCQELVPNPYEPLCKHIFNIPCSKTYYDAELGPVMTMEYCKEPCGAVLLDCKHTCKGTCGTCVGGRLHTNCKEPCGYILVCGHSCNEPCREACPPCTRNCEVRCQHSKCSLKCGIPCNRCKHPCQRQCSHGKCTNFCGDKCNVALCSEACEKVLTCGHACRGLCGELCPPICKICKPEEFPELFFGTEDEKDARFIQLMDCLHVVEVTSMDKFVLQSPDGEISAPSCPYCKTPIARTPRYSNEVKQAQRNIEAVKTKVFGGLKKNERKLFKLKEKLFQLKENKDANIFQVSQWTTMAKELKEKVNKAMATNKSRQLFKLSTLDINKLLFMFDVLKDLQKNYEILKVPDSDIVKLHANIILKSVKESGCNISEQLSHDLNNEISRLRRIVDVTNLEQTLIALSSTEHTQMKSDIKNIKARVVSTLRPFDEEVNKTIFEKLNHMRKVLTPQLKLMNEERVMIVHALNLKKGRWYVCPNNHLYTVSDCGGPVKLSNCPECKSVIGGKVYQLASGNREVTMNGGVLMQDYNFMNDM